MGEVRLRVRDLDPFNQYSPRRCDLQAAMRVRLGLDEMFVARWLARFMVSSARLGSARLNFFTSRADILARLARELAR